MHTLECERQGSQGTFWIVFNGIIPGMRCSCYSFTGNLNRDLYLLAGGVYTSIICFILVFLFDGFVSWTFLTLGFVQLAYGFFEYKYIDVMSTNKYTIGRYLIYVIIVFVMMLIYFLA